MFSWFLLIPEIQISNPEAQFDGSYNYRQWALPEMLDFVNDFIVLKIKITNIILIFLKLLFI